MGRQHLEAMVHMLQVWMLQLLLITRVSEKTVLANRTYIVDLAFLLSSLLLQVIVFVDSIIQSMQCSMVSVKYEFTLLERFLISFSQLQQFYSRNLSST